MYLLHLSKQSKTYFLCFFAVFISDTKLFLSYSIQLQSSADYFCKIANYANSTIKPFDDKLCDCDVYRIKK